jgi:hypothetical protein
MRDTQRCPSRPVALHSITFIQQIFIEGLLSARPYVGRELFQGSWGRDDKHKQGTPESDVEPSRALGSGCLNGVGQQTICHLLDTSQPLKSAPWSEDRPYLPVPLLLSALTFTSFQGLPN